MAIKNGTPGNDVLDGTAVADTLRGLAGNDTLNGGAHNDTLEGGAGDDRLNGGAGNDFYRITANPGTDAIVETAAGGTDTVLSTITFTLAGRNHVENLTLQGTDHINGTGNELHNKIVGNTGRNRLTGGAGNDTLDGGAGNDTTTGGGGNDVHLVAQAGDKVVDSTGTDTVRSSVTFAIDAGVENLVLTGTDNINGTGNGAVNILTGNTKNNTLSGAGGADQLSGGAGNDVLIWDALDTVRDGGANTDTLRVTANVAVNLASEPIANMEIVDLAGINTLTVAVADIQAGFTNDTLTVNGGAEDAVVAGPGWTRIADNGGYAVYTQDGATLKVDLDIDRSGIDQSMASINLGALDGANGFAITEVDGDNLVGQSVASAGDVNGDGLADLIIGANGAPYGNVGKAYIVFARATGFGPEFSVAALDGTNGFALEGENFDDNAGFRVAGIGDINDDGYADVIVGAYGVDGAGTDSGASYVIFGKASGFASGIGLGTLDGTNGFRINGATGGDFFGGAVAGAGDVNGDGYADLVIGANAASGQAGASYVVFGKASGFGPSVEISMLDGNNGFKLTGEAGQDYSGVTVSAAGDFNGDGYGDILIGALRQSAATGAGAAYLIYGAPSGFDAEINLGAGDLNGFKIPGLGDSDQAGRGVAGGGDVNGDGFDDIVVGAYGVEGPPGTDHGDSYVIFGKEGGFTGTVALASLDGSNGFRIIGAETGAHSGYSVAVAGDVNGDGYADLLIGAPLDEQGIYGNQGASYVVFGKAAGFSSSLSLGALDGTDGFRIDGIDEDDDAGRSVSAAGDVNGDGFDDLLVGARGADVDAGAAYVLYGRDFTGAVDFLGGAGANSITGTAGADVMVGGRGDDTMLGGGGADVLRGGEGDDRIVIADGGFLDVDGGAGDQDSVPGGDTLALSGELDLDLTAIADNKLTGIEVVDLVAGGGANVLTLDAHEVLSLSGTSNTLRIMGDGADSVSSSGLWTSFGTVEVDGVEYDEYRSGAAVLQVQSGIDTGGIVEAMAELDLTALDGVSGLKISGRDNIDYSGTTVSAAGDVNGDGYEDVIIATTAADPSFNFAYVVYGGNGAHLDTLHGAGGFDLTALDGTNGFSIGNGLRLGVSGGGDVNGDGYADLIVGSPNATAAAGASYVLLGGPGGASNVSVAAPDGESVFKLSGAASGDQAGYSLSTAGDVNGDGYDDFIVGAPYADGAAGGNSGAAYVVFGGADFLGDSSNLDLSALDGTNGFRINGEAAGGLIGRDVSDAGDVNGDGYDDLLVERNSGGGFGYVVFGGNAAYLAGLGGGLDLSALDGENGFRVTGGDIFVNNSAAGDINGDGYGDVIFGTFSADVPVDNAGAAYVVFGGAGDYLNSLHDGGFAASAIDGVNGIRINGGSDGDFLGTGVSGAGDVNGDGYDDLIVGAYFADSNGIGGTGASYVVFGGASGALDLLHGAAGFNVSALDGSNGFKISGEANSDRNGVSVSAAGDVNGDGYADLLVGAPGADPNGNSAAGASYIVFGRDFGNEADFEGGAEADSFAGGAGADIFVGGEGDDSMTGGGGADVFRGGAGNDRIVIAGATFFDVDGGTGSDTLALEAGTLLDLTSIANSKLSGIEAIELNGSGIVLTLALDDVLSLSDASNTLTIDGPADEDTDAEVVVTDSGDFWGSATDGDYIVYTFGAATLRVHIDVDIDIDAIS